MEFLGEVKIGTLCKDGVVMSIPKTPYDTECEIFQGSGLGDMYSYKDGDWSIQDSSKDTNNLLTWKKFNDNGKLILICDRVILNNISMDEINLFMNRNVTIDSKTYKMRLPNEREWLNSIESKSSIGLPVDEGYFYTGSLTKKKLDSYHNQFWNWVGVSSYIVSDINDIYIIGNKSPSYRSSNATYNVSDCGIRFTLELNAEFPVIQCDTGRLGEMHEPFDLPYTVTSYIDEDTVLIKEKFNGVVINEYSTNDSIINRSVQVSKFWNDISYGVHHIEIEASNKNGEVSTKKATFSTELPTFVDKNGFSYFTNKLWTDKIRPLVDEMSKKAGGLVLSSDDIQSGTDAVIENDNYCDGGKCIKVNGGTDAVREIKFKTKDLRLGKYALTLRSSVSTKPSSNEAFTVVVSKVSNGVNTEIGRKIFHASLFNANDYKVANMTFEYTGLKNTEDELLIEIITGVHNANYVAKVDYVLISPLLPALYS